MRFLFSSGLPGMFCAMSSLYVLFFACHRLESTTLQPSKVDGLVDAVCGLPSGIYALLQYLPVLNRTSSFVTSWSWCRILRRHRWLKIFNFCAICNRSICVIFDDLKWPWKAWREGSSFLVDVRYCLTNTYIKFSMLAHVGKGRVSKGPAKLTLMC